MGTKLGLVDPLYLGVNTVHYTVELRDRQHGRRQRISCEGDLDPQSGILLHPRHFRILSTAP